jgi:hypothetical protein
MRSTGIQGGIEKILAMAAQKELGRRLGTGAQACNQPQLLRRQNLGRLKFKAK